MANFRVEKREAIDYIALPVRTTMGDLPARVGAAFADLDAHLESLGLDMIGAGLIRYRTVSFDTPFTVEVAHAVASRPPAADPYLAGQLEAGTYAVAEQRGPYARIGDLTRELMAWGEEAGLDFAFASASGGGDEAWACWYEYYPDQPAEGPDGLEGTVQVCLLLE